jgi:hypothetical protein
MAAFDHSLIVRDQFHQLIKRKNWAAKESGVVLVFCIVAAVILLLTGLWLQRRIAARRAAKVEV